MDDIINFSQHFELRMEERNLNKQWILDTINTPDKIVEISDEETHFFKIINEFGANCLKVVVNPTKNLIITAHFDRKMTKTKCK